MTTVPAHLYKHVTADYLVKLHQSFSLSMAYQLIKQFQAAYDFCFDKGIHPSDCANDIYYEWQNRVHKQPVWELPNPLHPRICLGVKPL